MKRARAGRLLLGLLLLRSAAACAAADDLTVVKRAVKAERAKAPARREAFWLKVRVVDTGARRARVTVNLPLAMVRALGDDLEIPVKGCRLRLSEVLRTLESGEPLVEVESEDATVRVWVE